MCGWSGEPWFTLEPISPLCTFWPHVYMKTPVVIVGATEFLLNRGFVAQLYAALSVQRSYIVVLMESTDECMLVDALQQGGDRVVSVPLCSEKIFCALIKSLLPKANPMPYYFPYRLNTKTQTVTVGDRNINLRRKVFEIAHYLFTHNGTMTSKQTILQDVWGMDDRFYETRRVESQVSLAKKHLALDGSYGWTLRSSRGGNRGYGLFRVAT